MEICTYKIPWKFEFRKLNSFCFLPRMIRFKLRWKDKFSCPRLEQAPAIYIYWGYWQLSLIKGDDMDWEFLLWVNEYCEGDLQAAIENWPYKRTWPPVKKPEST